MSMAHSLLHSQLSVAEYTTDGSLLWDVGFHRQKPHLLIPKIKRQHHSTLPLVYSLRILRATGRNQLHSQRTHCFGIAFIGIDIVIGVDHLAIFINNDLAADDTHVLFAIGSRL